MTTRVPANCSSLTFTVSGVKAPVSRLVTGLTVGEENQMSQWARLNGPQKISNTNIATGTVDIQFPPGLLTSITINGNVKAVNGAGVCATVVGADATAFIGATQNEPFQIGAG